MYSRNVQAARPAFILSLITLLIATMLAVVASPAFAADELGSGDTPSAFDPATGLWTVGEAEPCYFGVPEDTPFLGDWNGDGVSTPGLYRPSDGVATNGVIHVIDAMLLPAS